MTRTKPLRGSAGGAGADESEQPFPLLVVAVAALMEGGRWFASLYFGALVFDVAMNYCSNWN